MSQAFNAQRRIEEMRRANEDPKIVARRVKAQQALSAFIKDIEAQGAECINLLVDEVSTLKVKIGRIEAQNSELCRENTRKRVKINHLNQQINESSYVDFRPGAINYVNPSLVVSELKQEIRAEIDARMGVSNLRDYWKNRALAAEGLNGC